MSDHSHTHPAQTGYEPWNVTGAPWAFIEYLLLDPMERRHYWWEIKTQMDEDEAESRRLGINGYERPS